MKKVLDADFPQNGFEAWGGYMQAKVAKLEEQFTTRAANENIVSNIFNGISIFVNGYTKPSADELKTLMAEHGGVYHVYQRSNDYIIATNLPDTKVKNQSLNKVVGPEWITESIAANKLLDYRDYLLYDQSRTQPKLNFIRPNNTSDISLKETENVALCKKSPEGTSATSEIINKSAKLGSGNDVTKHTEITRTAADPNFITDFYNNSRLHHISQLGAGFKQYINELRESSDFTFPARINLKTNIQQNKSINSLDNKLNFSSGKVIMHIDMDCFFVSVGLRNRPELRGRPIAVTHARTGHKGQKRAGVDREAEFNLYRQRFGRSIEKVGGVFDETTETRVDNISEEDDKFGSMSEIASCSYEARAKGIKNGMFMGAALKLCPDIIAIPYDFDGYKEVAYTLYDTVAQYTLDIEAVSCDEMYVDCTDLIKTLQVSVPNFATVLREEIRSKTGCPCSTGFGGNRLQARLATKCAKPDGQYFLTAEIVCDFMMDIKLSDLPGVGRQISQKLESLGHLTCGSLQCLTLPILQQHLGNKTGSQLYDQCRGIDSNQLNFVNIRKSVSAEVNYGIRFENIDQCTQFITQLATEVHSRMLQFKVLGKCITFKLMVRAEEAPVETAKFMGHGFCNTINKSVTLTNATNDLQVITKEVLAICNKMKVDPKEMRGLGIQISKLETSNSKNKCGAMNKFLIVKPTESVNRDMKIKRETTPKKVKHISPKKSPIINFRSPVKKCRKNMSKLKASTSVMNKFIHGNVDQKPVPVKTELKVEPKPKQEVFSNVDLPWKTVREMLRAWVDSKEPPLQYDINFLANYLRDMVIEKRIDKVKILLNFLGRKTNELCCEKWTNVYNNIVIEVQSAMIAVYGKELLL